MLNLQTSVIRHDRIVSTLVDNEVVMLDSDSGSYRALNAVGTYIWELLKESRNVREICDAVMEEFDVEKAICEKEIPEFVEKLISENLLVMNPDKFFDLKKEW
ncbi:MAG: PqqD family protein [Candidatus Riflebacteria bacterium]|nr:PqqD family protein [Candidatus Riflebacteria bacterium]